MHTKGVLHLEIVRGELIHPTLIAHVETNQLAIQILKLLEIVHIFR